MGYDYLSVNEAICCLRAWISAEFKGDRYQERLDMVKEIENKNMK